MMGRGIRSRKWRGSRVICCRYQTLPSGSDTVTPTSHYGVRPGGSDTSLPEQAAQEAALLLLLRGQHLGRRSAVGTGRLAVALRHLAGVGADAAGELVGLALAGQREVEVDAGHAWNGRGGIVVLDVHHQVAGGAEHNVVLQVLVARDVERGGELAVAR